jgi:hypothetical protein
MPESSDAPGDGRARYPGREESEGELLSFRKKRYVVIILEK